MEGKTPTEKVHSLSILIASLTEQVKALTANLNELAADHSGTAQALGDLKITIARLTEQVGELQRWKGEMAVIADLRTEVTILRREVDKLEKVKEEWTRRLWAIAGPVLGAVVGWMLGYFSRR
jgi:chromosome segregation ATPase